MNTLATIFMPLKENSLGKCFSSSMGKCYFNNLLRLFQAVEKFLASCCLFSCIIHFLDIQGKWKHLYILEKL